MLHFKGGYQNIDCGGLEINTAEKQTIAGIHAQVDKAYKNGKLVIACNTVWNSKAITPIHVFITAVGDVYICTASTLQIIVDGEDGVTIKNMAPAQAEAKKK